MSTPLSVGILVIGGNLAIIAAVIVGLGRALASPGWSAEARRSLVRRAVLILGAWYAAALALAAAGFFQGAPDRLPTIEIGLLLPIVIGAVALWRSEGLSRIVDAVPQSWLVGVQLYRVIGGVFVALYALGQLPGVFALPAGIGDLTVGVLAPIVAILYARGVRHREAIVAAWNLLGLLDLVVAVSTGFLSSPSPLQLLSFDAPNTLISAYPLVLVPVFAVPLSVLLHFASLRKVARAWAEACTAHCAAAAAR